MTVYLFNISRSGKRILLSSICPTRSMAISHSPNCKTHRFLALTGQKLLDTPVTAPGLNT